VKRLGYIPSLDGLRGIAIILVMLSHTPFGLFRTSGLGVDVFFALSGFLITTLIVQEYDRTNSVNLVAFYKRRALRLLPCLYAVLAVVVAICFLAPSVMPPGTVEQAVTASVYVANWHLALAPFFLGTPLAHTWSLAVEDQFYIIWAPLLVLALVKRMDRKLMIALVATAAFISALLCAIMINQPDGYDRAYFGTDSRSHALLIGCVAGLIFTASNIQIPKRLLWLAVVPGPPFWYGSLLNRLSSRRCPSPIRCRAGL
jgi:peptidoglycan/LPS O-acetylase OafA/YrhL